MLTYYGVDMDTTTATKTTTMTAKYRGTCSCGCGQGIIPGMQIAWSKTAGASLIGHAGSRTPAPAAKAPARRFRMGSGRGSAVRVAGYSSYCTDNASCRCYDCAS